jgi:transducin (beta)-like 1
MQQQMQNLH